MRHSYRLFISLLVIIASAVALMPTSCVNEQDAVTLVAPVVTIDQAKAGRNDVTLSCKISSDKNVQVCGFYLGTSPDLSGAKKIPSGNLNSENGQYVFSITETGLKCNTTYYYKGFASSNVIDIETDIMNFTTSESIIPEVSLVNIKEVDETVATVVGKVDDEGGEALSEMGVCLDTLPSPTIDKIKITVDYSVVDSFVVKVRDLKPGKLYYARFFATNSKGTGYSHGQSFETPHFFVPTVTTVDITDIRDVTAKASGAIASDGGKEITEYGFCYAKTPGVSIEDQTVCEKGNASEYTFPLTGLAEKVKYYIRAYAKNSKGVGYGEEKNFTTNAYTIPVIETVGITEVGEFTATATSKLLDDGNDAITERGVCWSTKENPTIQNDKLSDSGTEATFTSHLKDLSRGTKYYLRSYATNVKGTGYSDQISFTTLSLEAPVIEIESVTKIRETTASVTCDLKSAGNTPVTQKGVCIGKSENPTTSDRLILYTGDEAKFTIEIDKLTKLTKYHIRAFATNAKGTAYSADKSFTTIENTIPSVNTAEVTEFSETSAKLGGMVVSEGGLDVTARGVCWSTSENPTVELTTKTKDGTGEGAFVSEVTGLTHSTKYYVRAYAQNSLGTGYGEQVSFMTDDNSPSLSIKEMAVLSGNSAKVTVTLTDNGGSDLTSKGVYYGTSETKMDSKADSSEPLSGGGYSVTLTNLSEGTTYYVKPYATNRTKTGYGEVKTFKTYGKPVLVIEDFPEVTRTSMKVTVKITSRGDGAISEKGVCWSTGANPSPQGNKVTYTGDEDIFTVELTGLTKETTYYLKAYAINQAGTGLSPEVTKTTPSSTIPTVTTSAVSAVSYLTASCGGNVSDDGGADVTTRGVVWSTEAEPKVSLTTKTTDGTGKGTFTSSVSNLATGTKYYIRAYATNASGTAYGETKEFTTLVPAFTNLSASGTSNSYIVTSKGFYTFDCTVIGNGRKGILSEDNFHTTTATIAPKSASLLWVDTQDLVQMVSISEDYSKISFYVSSDKGNAVIVAYSGEDFTGDILWSWHIWCTDQPVMQSYLNADGKVFSVMDRNLGATSATQADGTATYGLLYQWGRKDPFKVGGNVPTAKISATVGTIDYTIKHPTTFITGIGNSEPWDWFYGVRNDYLWGNPFGYESSYSVSKTIYDPCPIGYITAPKDTWTGMAMTGSINVGANFIINAYNDIAWYPAPGYRHNNDGTMFYDNAIAQVFSNSPVSKDGTRVSGFYFSIYGGGQFNTLENCGRSNASSVRCVKEGSSSYSIPQLTTTEPSKITASGAYSGGTITSDGGSSVTSKGVCWSTEGNPKITNSSFTSDGNGTGAFSSFIKELTPSTTFYVRAYATNNFGTGYGAQKTFTTPAAQVPTMKISDPSLVTYSSAVFACEVILSGGASVSDRGICWSTSANPTVSDSKQSFGNGTGGYEATVTGLAPNTTYHARAYAKNTVGYGYSSDFAFTTGSLTNLSASGTANCYIVSSEGDYSLNAAVIGNGPDGLLPSYSQTDKQFHTETTEIAPKSAMLLWQDVSGLITDIQMDSDDGLLKFHVSSSEGNAVISVYSGENYSGTILWSWHIWATDQPVVQDYLNAAGKTFWLMDRNLGATSAREADGTATNGLYYQWGRKDPFKSGSITTIDGSSATSTIQYCVEHPGVFVTNTERVKYAWGNPFGNEVSYTASKSIYDPCPIGYRVPPRDTWTGASKTGSWNNGTNLLINSTGETAWYPAAGERMHHSGDFKGFSYVGYYWTSTMYGNSTTDSRIMSFASNWFSSDSNNHSFGCSIRCMKE